MKLAWVQSYIKYVLDVARGNTKRSCTLRTAKYGFDSWRHWYRHEYLGRHPAHCNRVDSAWEDRQRYERWWLNKNRADQWRARWLARHRPAP